MEAVSFVHPKRVPQMADAEDVMARVPRDANVSYIGLALNELGARRAVEAGVDEVNVAVLATDSFGERNQGSNRARMVDSFLACSSIVREAGLRLSLTVGAAFGCPFEGEVSADQVTDVIRRCLPGMPDEIALADTIGSGVPVQVRELAARVRADAAEVKLRFHFHNTRNTGYANAVAALEAGADALDASTGGIGGCPFAPNATGNIATEDLCYLMERSGISTGIDQEGIIQTSAWLGSEFGINASALLGRAGTFPSQAG